MQKYTYITSIFTYPQGLCLNVQKILHSRSSPHFSLPVSLSSVYSLQSIPVTKSVKGLKTGAWEQKLKQRPWPNDAY